MVKIVGLVVGMRFFITSVACNVAEKLLAKWRFAMNKSTLGVNCCGSADVSSYVCFIFTPNLTRVSSSIYLQCLAMMQHSQLDVFQCNKP